jgi:hypothetical protein
MPGKEPAVVGVPLMSPEEGFRVSPPGKLPLAREKV